MLEIIRERVQDDIEIASGINQVINWVEEQQPSQAQLQQVGSYIKQMRLGRQAESDDEVVQAAFVRGADKVIRHSITSSCARGTRGAGGWSVRMRGRL